MDLSEELKHLEDIETRLLGAGDCTEVKIKECEAAYREAKRYLAEYRSELDSMEIFANEKSIQGIEQDGNRYLQKREEIKKLIDSPYFARVDFKYEGEEEPEAFYIGRFSFSDNHDILIYDWRAPVSGMYYDYELGPASYQAPAGTIKGSITLKRQYKIAGGVMVYALESGLKIDDDVLQEELSRTSDDKMKAIIATLQKEQNKIIRNEKSHTLIIQGVAGSGKTAIALHRMAYLLYRQRDWLVAGDIVILSPNKVFADYISNVLPELGEEPIQEMDFSEIAADELEGSLTFLQEETTLSEREEECRFKSSAEIAGMIAEYAAFAEEAYFKPEAFGIDGRQFSGEYIRKRFSGYSGLPMFRRFSQIAEDIGEEVEAGGRMAEKANRKELQRRIRAMYQMKSTMEMYRDFYRYIRHEEFMPAPGTVLSWEDVFPYLYLKSFTEGLQDYSRVKHLVVDEMQDYTPIQYEVIKKLFHCRKTILGDFGQRVTPYNQNSLEVMKAAFPGCDLVRLNKSYRSTYEIIQFARRFQDNPEIDVIKRHGEVPGVVGCSGQAAEIDEIKKEIEAFKDGGSKTLGILLKTSGQAAELYQHFAHLKEVRLMTSKSNRFKDGIMMIPITMAKGLEFDEVLIPDVDAGNYDSEYERGLLYIACTRAMHKLSLFYYGQKSRFLK